MTHKRDRLSDGRWRSPRRVTHVIDECERQDDSVRPLLYSRSVERMTAEARARLINHLIQDDFGSRNVPNHHKPTKDTDPLCLSPSQQSVFHLSLKEKPVVPLYSSIVQNIRWCPDIEAFPCHADEGEENVKYTCRCSDCTSSSCASRTTSSGTIKRGLLRDNIARYCDQSTMTPRLTDAFCNVQKSITYIPDSSDPPCESPQPKNPEHMCTQVVYPKCTGMKCPPPILKKNRNYDECCKKKFQVPFDQEVVRDTDVEDHCFEPTSFATSYRLFSNTRNKKEKTRQYRDGSVGTSECVSDKKRKILYNEGICDSVIDRNPLCPARLNSPCDLKRDGSRASIRNRSRSRCYMDLDGYIPYSHTGHSKYHHDCKKTFEPTYKYGNSTVNDLKKLKACPFWLSKAYCNRKPTVIPCSNTYMPCYLPRKMISSEKNIESFIRCDRKC